ncbi:MAG: dipeptidase [Candidatus Bathyarchaeia archaeon]|nr:dipeptidase [Candidatus Bathyarchaeota archaeon]
MKMVDEEYVMELHRSSIVVDTHCDTLKCLSPIFTRLRDYWFVDRSSLGLGGRADVGHVDIPRLKEGGVDCQIFAISSARERLPPHALRTALEMLDIFYSECERNMESLVPATTYQGIVEAVKDGKIAAILSIEGADVIEGSLEVLRCFYRLGVRMVGLVHSLRNPLADGVSDSRTGGGLSELGVEVVEELERLGVLIDISHLSEAGFWDLINITRRPIVASHSNCRALCDHPRNLTDEQIRALAERRGVVGLSFVPQFIHMENASVQSLVDHIDHIVDIVGPRYVGLGSDFDGMPKTPKGLEDASKIPNITRELIRREYPEEEIRMILGENHLRVFREVVG